MEKRYITKFEETAYRLCHPAFAGMPINEAALWLDLSVRELGDMFANFEKRFPRLLPMMTKLEYGIYILYDRSDRYGWTQQEIADHFEISLSRVQRIITQLRDKGVRGLRYQIKAPRQQHYENWVDGEIQNRF